MIIELVEFVAGELNSSSGVIKSVTNETLTDSETYNMSWTPTPNVMSVLNDTGATIHFVPLTDREYNAYLSDHTITQLIPLANNTEKVMNDMRGEVTKIMCSGVTGHSSSATFVFYKD